MSCCDETTARVPPTDVSRRSLLKGAAVVASILPGGAPATAQSQPNQDRLLQPALVRRALRGGALRRPFQETWSRRRVGLYPRRQRRDGRRWSATPSTIRQRRSTSPSPRSPSGAAITRFAVTGRLPLFAPGDGAEDRRPHQESSGDLAGLDRRSLGPRQCRPCAHAVSAAQAMADANKVKFATMGVNLLEALRQGQVDAGLVQEPALTVLQQAGARVLVNAMDLDDARALSRRRLRIHGRRGAGQGDGAAQGRDGDALTKALADALKALHTMSGDRIDRCAAPRK